MTKLLLTRSWIAMLLLVLSVGMAQAQGLDQAITVYNQGEYDQAASLLDQIARDASLDLEVRKEALQYLGRAYIARSLYDDARQAVADLLALQPPLIELDPDVEPPSLMNLYYEVRDEIEVPKDDPGIRTLAVLDFKNYSIDENERWEPMRWGFPSMMIQQLSGATDLKLVERENLQWVLGELELQRDASKVDQATAVRIGKLMGAHAMVFGDLMVIGGKIRLSARVVKVETSEILLGESVEGKAKDFAELVEKLSLAVARSLNSTLTETEIGARTDTKNLDAMRSYSEGLSLLEQGDYQAAYNKFVEAQEFDPSYTRARLKAESLRLELAAANTAPESNTGSSGG